jgi:hypothetical protein
MGDLFWVTILVFTAILFGFGEWNRERYVRRAAERAGKETGRAELAIAACRHEQAKARSMCPDCGTPLEPSKMLQMYDSIAETLGVSTFVHPMNLAEIVKERIAKDREVLGKVGVLAESMFEGAGDCLCHMRVEELAGEIEGYLKPREGE